MSFSPPEPLVFLDDDSRDAKRQQLRLPLWLVFGRGLEELVQGLLAFDDGL